MVWHGLSRQEPELYWQQIHWPKHIEPGDALQLLRHLAADRRDQLVVLEVRSFNDQVNFFVGAAQSYINHVKQLVENHVNGAFVTSPVMRRTPATAAYKLKLTSRTRPLRVEHSRSTAKAILASMLGADFPDQLILQIVLGKRVLPIAVPTRTPETLITPWWQSILLPSKDDQRVDREKRTAFRTKVTSPGFRSTVRIGVVAEDRKKQSELHLNLLSGVRTAEANASYINTRQQPASLLNHPAKPWIFPTKLNINELLGLSAWPLGEDAMPGLDRSSRRLLYADKAIESSSRIIAAATAPGDKRMLGLNIDDALHHLHIIGPTGVGKSTLMLNLICQDIAAGRGVVVIDPKGDLVTDVLERIPHERQEDVVVLDPSDENAPVGLNPLLGTGSENSPEVIADHILAVFHGLYEDAWGPRTQDILHASLLTLASHPDTSLLMLPLLLTNSALRQSLVSSTTDKVALGPFWEWYEHLSNAERQQAIAPVMNKLRTFLLRPRMRAVIGQVQPNFQISDIFQSKKILLVSLAKGILGSESAALLGSLVIAQLRQATLGRAKMPANLRHPVTVFIDEFQDYMHLPADLADVLAQARGLGVGMTLAHQHLNQLPQSMRMALLANARSRICFQLSVTDAAMMAHETDLLSAEDFMSLGRYEVYASLVAGGMVMPFASGKTLPSPKRMSSPNKLRQLSQINYGQIASEVDSAIMQMAGNVLPTQPLGRQLHNMGGQETYRL
jgi:hypothetical protein